MSRGVLANLPGRVGSTLMPLWAQAPRVVEMGYADLQPLSVYLEQGVVPRAGRDDNHNALGANLDSYLRVLPGDIVFNKLRTWQGGLGVSAHEGIVSPAYFICRPVPGVEPRYLHYLLRSNPYLAEMTRLSKWMPPSQFDISWDALRTLPLLILPLAEQRRIADFLDDQVARLDRAIELRQRQVSLLNQHSLALIFAAVTGVDEPGQRRVAGPEWMGTVPSSWPVAAVSHQFEVLLGKMLAPDRVSGNYVRPYLRNTNVQWDRIDTDDLLLMDFPPQERSRYRVLPGDLLVCEGGEVGRAAIWPGGMDEIYYQKALHRLRPISDALPRWMYYCLRIATHLNVFGSEAGVTTIAHLPAEALRRYRFPFPATAIQRRLAEVLDQAIEQNGSLGQLFGSQMKLLYERKQALITAAVTGRLNVATARCVA